MRSITGISCSVRVSTAIETSPPSVSITGDRPRTSTVSFMLPVSSRIDTVAGAPATSTTSCCDTRLYPEDSTSTLYVPGASPETVNDPSGPVSDFCDVLVLMLVTVTAAFGTAASAAVVILPESVPADCARRNGAAVSKRIHVTCRIVLRMEPPNKRTSVIESISDFNPVSLGLRQAFSGALKLQAGPGAFSNRAAMRLCLLPQIRVVAADPILAPR